MSTRRQFFTALFGAAVTAIAGAPLLKKIASFGQQPLSPANGALGIEILIEKIAAARHMSGLRYRPLSSLRDQQNYRKFLHQLHAKGVISTDTLTSHAHEELPASKLELRSEIASLERQGHLRLSQEERSYLDSLLT